MAFTINGQSPEAFRARGCTITYRSQAADTATLTIDESVKEPPLTGAVTIVKGNATFTGTIKQPTRSWDRGGRHTLTAEGKWSELERTIVQLERPFDSFAGLDPRVLVGGVWTPEAYDSGGDSRDGFRIVPQAIDANLAAVATFCGITISGAPSASVPPREADGITTAEFIRALLRWFPGATAAFHGGATNLQIRNTSEADAGEPFIITPAMRPVTPFRLTQRTDLPLRGVRLLLSKKTISTFKTKEPAPTVYSAGETTGVDVLVRRIELMPEVHVLAAAALRLSAIEPTLQSWWLARDPALAELAESGAGTLSAPLEVQVDREHDSLVTEIQGGSVPATFEDGCSGPFAEGAIPQSVSNTSTPRVGEVRVRATFRFTPSGGGDPRTFLRTLTLAAISVSSVSSDGDSILVREDKQAHDPGEDPTRYSGLAAQILAASQRQSYEGEVSFFPDAVPASLVGRRLVVPFMGAEGAALETDTAIHEMSVDCFSGAVTVRIGPPGYLSADDLIEKARMFDGRRPPRAKQGKEDDRNAPPPSTGLTPRPPAAQTPPPTVYGRVKVTISPDEAIAKGAAWYVAGEGSQSALGPFASGKFQAIPAGDWNIYFETVTGYDRPALIPVTVGNGTSATFDGDEATYTPTTAGQGAGPWAIELRRITPSDPASGWEARVALESHLYVDLLGNKVEVTGLDSWTPISGDRKIFLRGEFNEDGELPETGAVTVSDVSGGSDWPAGVIVSPSTPSPSEPQRQTVFNRPLAEIKLTDGVPSVLYHATTHLILQYHRHQGCAVLYPVAF